MPKRLLPILNEYDIEPLLLFLGGVAVVWGIWLMMPWDSSAAGVMFAYMNRVAPEWTWGVSLIGVGLIQIFGVASESQLLRRGSCVIAFGWWVFMAVTIGLGDRRAPGVAVISFYAVAELYAAMRD